MLFSHYACKFCGHEFRITVRTQPGPSLLDCPSCEFMTAVREPGEMRVLRNVKAASLSGCCNVQLRPGSSPVPE